ncbi:exopolysaccharide biosynthesis polyprenyl glycosylphosphotransferase [uncultured Shewanella sp.]|uniref:exopolysaccharide biosynthesis polyprenyl glycosylphosphotransferase n=1 Tax=uncultured Shewanella sp. TaxID=173975 RepID=UPI00261BFF2D|nr:exopolysaccharide biosynthesis polyprenyl glycosylphosphotransferase [uncultured Shewanella sp.]
MKIFIRFIDILFASLLLILFSPILLYMWLKRRWQFGKSIELIYIYGKGHHLIGLYQFTGGSFWTKLPQLFNLLEGEITLLGIKNYYSCEEKPKINHKPGLMSFEIINANIGLSFESEKESLTLMHKSIRAYCLALVQALFSYMLFSSIKPHKKQAKNKLTLLGISLKNMTMVKLISTIISKTRSAQKMEQFIFMNADCFNISVHNNQYKNVLKSCQYILGDGIGIRIASIWKGIALKDNLNGSDMFPLLCKQLAQEELPLYLLGGKPGIAEKVAKNMQKQYPKLIIAGTQHGYYHLDKSTNNHNIINAINQSKAKILLVAMGVPTQELWLNKYQSQLKVGVGIGVGGLFDFYSDNIKRAPLWLRQMGMEWVYRLIQEPKRMWKRYIIGNPFFLIRIWKDIRQSQKQKPSPSSIQQSTLTRTKQTFIQLEFNAKKAKVLRSRHLARQKLNKLSKRILDILISTLAIIILSPLLLLIALLIRLESSGPVFYSQQRAGMDNRPFTMWKFRSMYLDANERLKNLTNEMQGGVIFKMKSDPRITKVGKAIRKTSIDELPQLWNVLKGDMSLVGPRPALPTEVEQYNLNHRTRLSVKPGITCIWQVTGRSDIPFEQQVELDTDYIYQQSLLADIWLLIKTIPAVILTRGAY